MKQHIFQLESKTYVIYPFNFIEGKRIEARLLKYAAPVLSKFVKADAEAKGQDEDSESQTLSAILEGITDSLKDGDINDFVQLQVELLSKVQCNGSQINLDREFECEFDKALDLMKEVIVFNFRSVFQLGIAVV